MPKTIHTEYGTISIAEDVIATVAGLAAMDCYGLVGMASRKQVKDSLSELLGRDNPGRGVEVRISGEDVQVDLYIVVSYGVNIYEVAQNVRDKVRYVLNESIGIAVDRVNIFVQSVRVAAER
ncbi:MAG: Asp23/Gls24 family envelope stress response protein [Alicyclobacillus macrosporangiidus]|uniref:Asp23/Gls24 family envelope stress response protein n=1 Tax=Alicyclobacillus macrosporangiidus TaxID=392015 RepID=UPI0026ECE35D|nr:Asp23/Gls24 family envelope stress response protein [Alicyclobacillus macrosporangiidus]MCL6598817.1 Asp23/Gls24 family envelope stress response protein [Alicyclobacillus macrosporangiidus]